EVAQEDVRDAERDDEVRGVERREPERALPRERAPLVAPPRLAGAHDRALDPAINSLEEDRLGARLAAPRAPEEGGRVNEPEAYARDEEEDEPHVLRVEREAEEEESAMLDVEEHRGISVDRKPRKQSPNRDEEREYDLPERREPAAHVGGV